MRLPRAWTDADGAVGDGGEEAVFSVEAIRALVETVEALQRRRVVEVIGVGGSCQGPEVDVEWTESIRLAVGSHGPARAQPSLDARLLMTGGYLALHLTLNRPLPVSAWVGGALVVLACNASLLVGSRMRTDGPYARLRHFARVRAFAAAELRRPNPRLEDAWTTRLEALGLRGEIAAWRQRFGGAGQLAPDLSSGAAAEPMSGPRYTARVPEPFAGPGGWTEALYVNVDPYADADEEEDVDEDG